MGIGFEVPIGLDQDTCYSEQTAQVVEKGWQLVDEEFSRIKAGVGVWYSATPDDGDFYERTPDTGRTLKIHPVEPAVTVMAFSSHIFVPRKPLTLRRWGIPSGRVIAGHIIPLYGYE